MVRPLAERIEEIQQLDSAGEALKSLVDRYVPPRTELKDLLSGTWLGHPLHPVLTDVVLGAWTSSFLLDLLPGRRTRKASDRLVDIGILAAVPTALAGLSDWADVWGRPRGWGWSTPAPTPSRCSCTCARRWPASGGGGCAAGGCRRPASG